MEDSNLDIVLARVGKIKNNKKLNLTPIEDLIAEDFGKVGTKKSFISRVEKGKADIQLSTLVKVFRGVGREISVRVL